MFADVRYCLCGPAVQRMSAPSSERTQSDGLSAPASRKSRLWTPGLSSLLVYNQGLLACYVSSSYAPAFASVIHARHTAHIDDPSTRLLCSQVIFALFTSGFPRRQPRATMTWYGTGPLMCMLSTVPPVSSACAFMRSTSSMIIASLPARVRGVNLLRGPTIFQSGSESAPSVWRILSSTRD